jgi:hypothetical protein
MTLELLLWFGMTLLYVGFWGMLGAALRRTRGSPPATRVLWSLGAALILLPATVFVIGQAGVALGLRLVSLITGMSAGLTAYCQPPWAPALLWSRPFTRVYLAFAMAITALWEASLLLGTASLAAPLLGAAAGVAGVASLGASRRAA